MRLVKIFITLLFVVIIVAVAVIYFLILPRAGSHIKTKLEQSVKKQLGSELKIGYLDINSLWPIKIQAGNIAYLHNGENLKAQIKQIHLEAQILSGIFEFKKVRLATKLSVLDPSIEVRLPFVPTTETQANAPVDEAEPTTQIDFDSTIALDIQNGATAITMADGQRVSLEKLAIQLNKDTIYLKNDLFEFSFSALIKGLLQDWPIKIPISFSSKKLKLSHTHISTDAANLEAGGLRLSAAGYTALADMSGVWKGQVNIPELAQLPEPPSFLPAGQWQGSVTGAFNYTQRKNHPPQLTATLKAPKISGTAKLQQEGIIAQGPIQLAIDTDFSYYQELKISKLLFSANLNKATIKYKDILDKPAGVPLWADIDGAMQNNRFGLSKATVQFAQLNSELKGAFAVNPKASSQGSLRIAPTSLKGLEKYLPFLRQYPLRGSIELKGQFSGPLGDPMKLNVSLRPLKAQSVSGYINYNNKENKTLVQGPVSLDAYANLEAKGSDLRTANIKLKSNLSKLKVTLGEKFKKTASQMLTFDLSANKKANNIVIKRGFINFHGGTALVTGSFSRPQKPRLNLNLTIPKLNMTRVSEMLPANKDSIPPSTVSTKLKLTGVFDPSAGLQKSPLTATGSLSVLLPSYTISPQPKPVAVNKESQPPASKAEPLLPDWPIIKNSKIAARLQVNKFQYDKIGVRGINTTANYNRGRVLASGSIEQIFGAPLNFAKVSANLLTANPNFAGQVSLKGQQLEPVVAWLLPDKAGLVKGQAFGTVDGQSPMPGGENFVKQISSAGQINLKKLVVKSKGISSAINEKLAKYPQIYDKKKSVKIEDIQAEAKAQYRLAKGVVNVANVNIATNDGHEFNGKGTLDLDFNTNFKGTAYLKDPPIKGSIYNANLDKKGRFTLPLAIKGNIMDPQIDFAKETINQLLANTFKYEQKKALKKAGKEAKKKVGKELEKQLKGLFK